MFRNLMIALTVVITLLASSAFAGDWRYNFTVYDSENMRNREIEISYSVDQELSPALIWSVKTVIDNFIRERNYEFNNLTHLCPIVKDRLQAKDITGFQIVAVGIQ